MNPQAEGLLQSGGLEDANIEADFQPAFVGACRPGALPQATVGLRRWRGGVAPLARWGCAVGAVGLRRWRGGDARSVERGEGFPAGHMGFLPDDRIFGAIAAMSEPFKRWQIGYIVDAEL